MDAGYSAIDVITGATPWAVDVCDCRDGLRQLPAGSVHCCITSPPYWGLRDYGLQPTVWGGDLNCEHRWGDVAVKTGGGAQHTPKRRWQHSGNGESGHPSVDAGQFCRSCNAWLGCLGLEADPYSYVDHIVEVFAEVRRVLRKDGTLWINMGDCYANDGKWGGETAGKQSYLPDADRRRNGREKRHTGLKAKDLVGLPWMVAFALRAAGWWLRSDIIWNKPNSMPESVNDRPTKSHEYLFLMSKSPRYFYDPDAILEPAVCGWRDSEFDGERDLAVRPTTGRRRHSIARGGFNGKTNTLPGREAFRAIKQSRNKRTVWTIPTQPYPGAHFATFPTDLVAPCILAGTSEKGCCPHCGAGRVRKTKVTYQNPGNCQTNGARSKNHREINQPGFDVRLEKQTLTVGWRNGCDCGYRAAEAVPAIVIDPFNGSGTTGLVARLFSRRYIGFEASADYAAQAAARIMNRGARSDGSRRPLDGQSLLF